MARGPGQRESAWRTAISYRRMCQGLQARTSVRWCLRAGSPRRRRLVARTPDSRSGYEGSSPSGVANDRRVCSAGGREDEGIQADAPGTTRPKMFSSPPLPPSSTG